MTSLFQKTLIIGGLVTVALAFQNCAEDFNPDAYSEASGQSLTSAPVVTSAPQAMAVTYNMPLVATVTAKGANLVYRWYKDDVLLPAATSSTYSVANALPSHGGKYRVEVENPYGSASRTFDVTVSYVAGQNPPIVTTVVKPLVINYINGSPPYFWLDAKAGDQANYNVADFSVMASGSGLTYQWYTVNSLNVATPIAGATLPNYSVRITALNQLLTYRVVVTNAYGQVMSQAALTGNEVVIDIGPIPQF